jgi:hypothetical protein
MGLLLMGPVYAIRAESSSAFAAWQWAAMAESAFW